MLWVALHLPALSLEAFAATLGASAGDALPLALLDGHRVQAVNGCARRLGVEPGCRRATALALAPQLRFGTADASRDAQALRAVAHAALAFTPMVAIDEAAALPCVLLEVQGSQRYFGGLAKLQQRLRAAVAPLKLSHRLASAPTAAGAALLARWRDGLALGAHATDPRALHALVDDAPAWLTGAGGEHGGALQGMGLHTIGALCRLPRSALARRFGEALLLDIDRIRGNAPDPRDPVVPEAAFEARLDLPMRADSSEQLLAAAAVLLARLVAWAQAQHARIGGFVVEMRHEPRHRADADLPDRTEVAVALAEASNDARHLHTLLRERLARTDLPAPTLELRLHGRELVRDVPPNGELFPAPASAQQGLARLVERLQARLGPDRVQHPVSVDDHRPERATAWQPALPRPGGRGAERPPGAPVAAVATRPVWLLAQPQPLAERRSRPWLDGAPLQLLAGPERIESGWWDGAPALRDYFIARAGDGALVWVYRARLPTGDAGADGWFLHGRFG